MSLKTKKTILLIVFVASIVTIAGTISYAYFTSSGTVQRQEADVTIGTMQVHFEDEGNEVGGSINFGESITKKFTITNTGTLDASIGLKWIDLINTYQNGSLTYTFSYSENTNAEESEYIEVVPKKNVPRSETASNKVLLKSLEVPTGKTYYCNLKITLNYLEDVNQDADLNATFYSKFNAVDSRDAINIVDDIIASSKGVRTDFDSVATTNEGVYEMPDDYGTSYYFRGAVTNNYVKFGKNKDGSDMYWRIIRVNGDGSLRMIYDGTSAHANGEESADRVALTGVKWNLNYDDAKYAGYMFGGANGVASTSKEQAQTNQTNSNIKTQVDAWYKENIVDTGYSEYISDEIFCNDRSTPGKSVSEWTQDTGLGYGKNVTAYGAFGRFSTGNNSASYVRRSNPSPKFTCSQKNDAFTVSDTERGNGALTYPVGLITADEIITAGGRYWMSDNSSSNNKYYLYKSNTYWYWSLSPFFVYANGYACVFGVHYSGSINPNDAKLTGAVAPVINLSAGYSATLEGAGSAENPYVLSTRQF